jgi:hypothetical protein
VGQRGPAMVADGECERFQADHAARPAGRAAGLPAAVHQQPGLPEIQEKSRPADQRPSRLADLWATCSTRDGVLASRRIRVRLEPARPRRARALASGPVQLAARCSNTGAATLDLLPDDGPDRNPQQHLVSQLPPIQPSHPLLIKQRPGKRSHHRHPISRHHRHRRRRPAPKAALQPIPPQPKLPRPKPASQSDTQQSQSRAPVNHRIPPPVPQQQPDKVV